RVTPIYIYSLPLHDALPICRGHLADPLAVHLPRGHPGVERQLGEDPGLRGRVVAVDVGGRVGLGVAECGGLVERVGEARARLGQDRKSTRRNSSHVKISYAV